jgi:zona occludens toxin
MTQSLGKLNKNLRDMIEIQYQVSKHTAAGSQKTYTQKVMDGAVGRPTVMNTNVRRYKSEFFPFYTSHTKSNSSVQEAMSKDIRPIWKNWTFIGAGLCALFVIYKLFSDDVNPLSTAQASDNVPAIVAPESAPLVHSTPNVAKPIAVPKNHPFSKVNFHISGWSESGYFDKQGKYNADYRVYFTMTRNGQSVGELKMRDFLLAGYDVDVLGECVVRLRYEPTNYDDFILCDSPSKDGGMIEGVAML